MTPVKSVKPIELGPAKLTLKNYSCSEVGLNFDNIIDDDNALKSVFTINSCGLIFTNKDRANVIKSDLTVISNGPAIENQSFKLKDIASLKRSH